MDRPRGLTVIGWFAIAGGVLQIIGSLGLVGIGSLGILIGSTGALEALVLVSTGFPMWTGIVLIALGVLGIVFGAGVLALRSWAWVMGIVIYTLNLLAGVALLALVGLGATMVFVTLLSAAIVGYLFTSTARDALGHHAGGGMTGTPHAA